jgi:arylsulfatase A-like enzyme
VNQTGLHFLSNFPFEHLVDLGVSHFKFVRGLGTPVLQKQGLRPHERGFDYHFGFLGGAHNYMPGGMRTALVRNGEATEERDYLTDAFARESAAFIERSKEGPFFLYLAFNAVHWPLEAPKVYEEKFAHIADPKRRTYAGMLAAMDDGVGRVLAALRKYGLEDDTLIFFYSDNGGPTPQTTSSNAPLRGYKGQVWEGGIRVPFLAQWKGTIPAGVVYPNMVMGFDVHATALAVAGGAMPTDKPLDGVNLLPFLTGKNEGAPHERLFWRASQQSAMREGDWKLIKVRGETPQLYNLKEDIGESRNLAGDKPELLHRLQSAYAEWDRQMMPAQWVRQDARSADATGRERGSAASRSGILQERFDQFDRNRDGRVSATEFPRADIFQRMDSDKDGVVTVEEVRRYYQGRRQQERD